jgi:hypothetical protein
MPPAETGCLEAPTRSAGSRAGAALRPQPEAQAAGLTLRSRAGTVETIPLRTVRKPFAPLS